MSGGEEKMNKTSKLNFSLCQNNSSCFYVHSPSSFHRLTWLYLDIYDEIQECQSEENTYQQHPTMARVGNELRNITRKVSSVYKMKNIFFKWIKLKAIFAIENDDATWKLESFSVSETGGCENWRSRSQKIVMEFNYTHSEHSQFLIFHEYKYRTPIYSNESWKLSSIIKSRNFRNFHLFCLWKSETKQNQSHIRKSTRWQARKSVIMSWRGWRYVRGCFRNEISLLKICSNMLAHRWIAFVFFDSL